MACTVEGGIVVGSGVVVGASVVVVTVVVVVVVVTVVVVTVVVVVINSHSCVSFRKYPISHREGSHFLYPLMLHVKQ